MAVIHAEQLNVITQCLDLPLARQAIHTMEIALAILCLKLAALLWLYLRQFRHRNLRRIAAQHVRDTSIVMAEEGPVAAMSNFGVVYYSRCVAAVDNSLFVLVHRRFFRGGFPEGQDIHIDTIHVLTKVVESCTLCGDHR